MELIRSPYAPAWEFLQNASEYTSLEALQEGFGRAAGAFGFDRFSCALMAKPGSAPSPRILFGRCDRAESQYRLEQTYLSSDACISQISKCSGPFAWSDLTQTEPNCEATQILAQAAEAGALEGFVVPVLGGAGELYGVLLTSPQKAFDQAARPTLHALAAVYVFEGVKLLELADDIETRTPLTLRETECLRWVSEGKSDWDISEILGISEATVHGHIENAKRKMGVRSRIQATVRAVVRGWIGVNPPDQRGRSA